MLVSNEVKRYGSESCHAYDREGNPQHSVPYKDKKRKGEMRPTTLRDIKERGWYPSVSAILGVVEKKGLDGWKKRQVAEACLQEVLEHGVSNDEEFILQSLERAETNMTKARDLGTEIHGAIERFLRGGGTEDDLRTEEFPYSLHVEAAVAALRELGVWGQPFSAERTFASPLGYGGTCDWISEGFIIDFKAINTLSKRYDWPERSAQIAAYQMGVHGKLCRGANILISTEEPGTYAIREWSVEELEYGWSMFEASFALWRILSRYDPLKHVPS